MQKILKIRKMTKAVSRGGGCLFSCVRRRFCALGGAVPGCGGTALNFQMDVWNIPEVDSYICE